MSRSDIADPSPIRPGQKVTLTQSYLDEMYYVLQPNYFYVVLLNRCKNKSLKRYFAEAIYRDDVPHALRYIVLAIYPRNDVSLERCIVGTMYRWNEISQESSDISSIYRSKGVKKINNISEE